MLNLISNFNHLYLLKKIRCFKLYNLGIRLTAFFTKLKNFSIIFLIYLV